MAEKSLTDLPRNVREQFDKGLAALERSNWDYAIELLLGVVKAEPAFLTGREALRKGALKKAGAGTGLFKKIVSSAGSGPALARAKFLVESQPLEAMFSIEQVLAGDPRNSLAHDLFAKAAVVANLPRSAILSLEALRQESPTLKLYIAGNLLCHSHSPNNADGAEKARAAVYGPWFGFMSPSRQAR